MVVLRRFLFFVFKRIIMFKNEVIYIIFCREVSLVMGSFFFGFVYLFYDGKCKFNGFFFAEFSVFR